MPHNVRVLANAESITTNNQASEQKDNFLTYSHEYVKGLLEEIQQLKTEKLRLYNESNHYKDTCIELLEKLQGQPANETSKMRVAR